MENAQNVRSGCVTPTSPNKNNELISSHLSSVGDRSKAQITQEGGNTAVWMCGRVNEGLSHKFCPRKKIILSHKAKGKVLRQFQSFLLEKWILQMQIRILSVKVFSLQRVCSPHILLF